DTPTTQATSSDRPPSPAAPITAHSRTPSTDATTLSTSGGETHCPETFEPFASKGATRGLRALPVAGRDAFPADEKPSGASRRDGHVTLVDHPHLVAGDGPAERSRPAFAGPVREEDVQRLGGAEAVDDVLAEALLLRSEGRL